MIPVSDTIYIENYNEVHLLVTGSNDGLEHELSELFTFHVPGYKFMPAYKRGIWDGRIRLYNRSTKLIYKGLVNRIIKWADQQEYQVEIGDNVIDKSPNISDQDVEQFVEQLNLPDWLDQRSYQLESFKHAINSNRATILSPTGSGKSLIIYMIMRYLNNKTLIVVPTTGLVHQMADDFASYHYDQDVHLIYSGKDKQFDQNVAITTWQSIHRLPRNWFDQFDTVIVDETHQAKAKSITNILEKLSTCKYRFGTTGTLDGTQTNQLVIEGLLGPVHRMVSTSQLIDDEVLAKFNIEALVVKYPAEIVQTNQHNSYQDEVDLIVTNPDRNQLIYKLVSSISGNNLVLFNFVDKHGKQLEKLFRDKSDRPIYYIDGSVDPAERNRMRSAIEKETDCIVIASQKAFATGTNVVRLNNIFFTSPSKSRIQTLQAIGRVLRKSPIKQQATLFDLADDLSTERNDKRRYNYTMVHFFERLKIYKNEQFPFQIRNIRLSKDSTNETNISHSTE